MKKLLFLIPLLFAVNSFAQTPTIPPFATPTAAPSPTSIVPAPTPTVIPTPAGVPYVYNTTGDNLREFKMGQLLIYFNATSQNFSGNTQYVQFSMENKIDQDFNAYIYGPLLASIQGKLNNLSYQQLLQICPLVGGTVTPNVTGVTKCQ